MDIKCQNIRCEDELKRCDETFLFGFLRNQPQPFNFDWTLNFLITI